VFDAGADESEGTAAYWHALHVDTPTVGDRLTRASAFVRSLGSTPAARMVTLLGPHIRCVDEPEQSTVEVVVVDDYLDPALSEVNIAALKGDRSWFLVKPVGTRAWIGPLFRPGRTGCWECLAQRLRNNRQVEAFLERRLNGEGPLPTSKARVDPYVDIVLGLASLEVSKAVATATATEVEGAVVTLDTLTLRTERHALVRRPQCPSCGDPRLDAERRAVALAPTPKTRQSDGGHRTVHPEVTMSRLEQHISPITGVVTNLDPLEVADSSGLAYSYAAGHNFALMRDDLRFLMQNLRGRSGGKGATQTQAKVSAVCEAIERYSGVYRGNVAERRSSFADLGSPAIHPYDLMLFSDRQYSERMRLNRGASLFHTIPEPFDDGREIAWTPAWSLTDEAFKEVPTAYCYYGHPDLAEWFFSTSDGNGSAAGNTIEEATLQGCMELIERDSVALWWYNRVRRPAVDLDSVADAYVADLQEWYRRQQRSLWVLDITSDLGVPVFAAVSHRTDHPIEDILMGFGAHFDPMVALKRALTELNQFMPAVAQRDAMGNTRYWFPGDEAVEWWRNARLETEPYLVPHGDIDGRRIGDFDNKSSDDLRDDVERCRDLLADHGLEMLVLDQTQPDIGLSVVKVMVPGLRHFWKRFGRGRLYDVPVDLGWLEEPRREEELNASGIFF
jgi:bacteriocin biosynthesis cyclodehydratase domain-containing protein